MPQNNSTPEDSLQNWENSLFPGRQFDTFVRISIICGIIAVAGSSVRMLKDGIRFLNLFDLIVFGTLILIAIFKRSLFQKTLMKTVAVVSLLTMSVNLYFLGLGSLALLFFLWVVLLFTVFGTLRESTVVLILIMVILSVFAFLICTGRRVISVDMNRYLFSWRVWFTQISSFAGLATITLFSLSGLKKRLTGLLHDLETRTKELEKVNTELLESRNKTSAILETAPEAIVTADTGGIITSCNKAAIQLYEFTDENEMIGLRAMELIAPEDRKRALENRNKVVAEKSVHEVEYSAITKNGKRVPIRLAASLLQGDADKPSGFIMSVQDISESKKMEERVRQVEKMQAIGQFAGGMAHDFNNMIGAIIGLTELSLLMVDENSEVAGNLRQVMTAANRSKELTGKILVFSRKSTRKKQYFDAVEVLHEVLDLLSATIPSSVTMTTDIEDAALSINGDPTGFHEVVMNLVSNAVYAMDSNGVLQVCLKKVRMETSFTGLNGISSSGNYVQLEVADTGSGMDASTLEQAFEPFYTTKAVGQGTGMGLSVVMIVVREHTGNITVESSTDSGTTFRLFFPLTEPVDEETPSVPIIGNESGRKRILFVDDDKLVSLMAEKVIASLGYEISVTNSSAEALSFFRQEPYRYDCIITDQEMPELKGLELAGKIRALRRDIPVILCSAFSKTLNEDSIREAGITSIMTKPFTRAEIAAVISSVLKAE